MSRVTCHEVTCCRVQQQANCWSSFSWSSLYDRGTDSSLSWADDVGLAGYGHVSRVTCHVQEYERETTETVRRLLAEVEELFYAPPAARRQRKGSEVSAQERECQQWREQFPSLR